jgi:hypothetical protein
MMKWILALLVAVAVAGCGADDGDDRCASDCEGVDAGEDAPLACPEPGMPGGPSGGCELVVNDVSECPSIAELCRPDICGAHDCCYCDPRGFWGTVITDCLEGC